jgi:hypothetical protein
MSLQSIFSRYPAFGFSGSRSPAGRLPVSALSACASAVPVGSRVFVGCASGVDAYFRQCFPSAEVFSVASGRWGSGRSAFARRSVACVRAVGESGGLWVSFPASPCPSSLVPASSSSSCFCGSGSGTWASLAFAVGSDVPSLVFSPAGIPASWGLSPVAGCPGWFGCPLALGLEFAPVQLSLF